MQPIEERLELVRFKVDKTAHIRINSEVCKECDTTPCVYVCPAGLCLPNFSRMNWRRMARFILPKTQACSRHTKRT